MKKNDIKEKEKKKTINMNNIDIFAFDITNMTGLRFFFEIRIRHVILF